LEAAFKKFEDLWRQGERPDPEDFCEKFPEYHDELLARIREFVARHADMQTASVDASRPDDRTHASDPAQTRDLTSAEMPSPKTDLTGETLGDFRVIREIGRGGMGVVYEAEQISLRRPVALKVLPTPLSLRENVVARFRRESSTAGRLRHPGIVEIYSTGEEAGYHYFAMEFIEGSPLDRVVEEMRSEVVGDLDGERVAQAVLVSTHWTHATQARMASEEKPSALPTPPWGKNYIGAVCRIVAQLGDALEYAHQAGVIHRDVKPANILLRADGSAVLTDFGLAREEALPSLTMTGGFAGTPYYVSPEQLMGGGTKVDHRTDVYSLGVTLFELLTLRRPFEGKTTQQVFASIMTSDPPRPKKLNPELPRDLVTIVLKAMERNPADRYPTATAFASDLRAFLEYRPIQAQPPGPIDLAAKWIRRHPVRSTVAAFATLAMVLLFGGLFYQSARKERTFQLLLSNADRERGSGNLVEAIRLLTVALDQRPDDPLATMRYETYKAEREREEKETEARAQVERGKESLDGYFHLSAYLEEKTKDLDRLQQSVVGHEGPETKRPLLQLENEIRQNVLERERLFAEAISRFQGALSIAESDFLPAVDAMAKAYFSRVEAAETAGDVENAALFRGLLAPYDRSGLLDAPGRLTLETDPSGLDVFVFRYVEKDRRLWPAPFFLDRMRSEALPDPDAAVDDTPFGHVAPSVYGHLQFGPENCLGKTPIDGAELPVGSYLLVLRGEGFGDVRYPVLIRRGQETKPFRALPIYPIEEYPDPDRWVYIPPGRSILGGDRNAIDAPHHRREVDVEGFFISKFEVTVLEYVQFLLDEQTTSRILSELENGRVILVPRERSDSDPLWKLSDEEGVVDLRVPSSHLRRPIFSISGQDAQEYIDWLNREAERDHQPFRFDFPTEDQWERAARGADGRFFPWGNGFDWTFCSGMRSRPQEVSLPEPVGLFPADESPFGVRDLGGGMTEWCVDPGNPERLPVRGGYFRGRDPLYFRCAGRIATTATDPERPAAIINTIGLRVVCVPVPRTR